MRAAVGLALLAACRSDPTDCKTAPAGTLCEIAGTGKFAFNGAGHAARDSALYLPSAVRRGPDGLLYIVDYNNMRLRRIEADGTLTTVVGNGFHAGAREGVPAPDSPLENPIDFDFLPDGEIVLLQYHLIQVERLRKDGTLQLFAGNPYVQGVPQQQDGDGGPATQAIFIEPTGIAIAPDATVYISDDLDNRVRVIHPDGTIDAFVDSVGAPGYAGDGGPATAAQINHPTALALDKRGDLFVVDADNSAVREVRPDGTITTVAGTGTKGFAGDGGPATHAALDHPNGIAVADDGTLFIADRGNSRIRKVTPDGTITTIAGDGKLGWAGDGEPPLHGEFKYVAYLSLDTDGSLLIADQGNSRVRRLKAPL
jgi:hypothetical protein